MRGRVLARLGILPGESRAREATRVQLAFMDYWLDRLEVEKLEAQGKILEQLLGLRFRKEDLQRSMEKARAVAQLDPRDPRNAELTKADSEIYMPFSFIMNAIVTGILEGGIFGMLEKTWNLSAIRTVGPSNEVLRAVGGAPIGDAERVDPGQVINMFGFSKEQLFELFPLIRARAQGPGGGTTGSAAPVKPRPERDRDPYANLPQGVGRSMVSDDSRGARQGPTPGSSGVMPTTGPIRRAGRRGR